LREGIEKKGPFGAVGWTANRVDKRDVAKSEGKNKIDGGGIVAECAA
jgi:hypothetical protein